uniref:Uncharacterized protein n=1 Tax=Anopheles farauti TaxID=69004 RepID=A0A182QPJ7_9DIPT
MECENEHENEMELGINELRARPVHLAGATESSYGPDDPVRAGYQALTLAAFRSPGLLGTHGFSFGSNFGFRDPSSSSSPSPAYDPSSSGHHPVLGGAPPTVAGSLLNLSQHAAATAAASAHFRSGATSGSPVNLYLGSSRDDGGAESPYGRGYGHELSSQLGSYGGGGGGEQEKVTTDQDEDEINILPDGGGSRGTSPINGRLNGSSSFGSEGSPEPAEVGRGGGGGSSKHRREESCGSPLGSARSYSSQTKDGELVGLVVGGSYPLSGSPTGGEDSVGSSHSPENLSHGGVCDQQQQHHHHQQSQGALHTGAVNHNHLAAAGLKGKTPHTISDMLDHKLQLSFLGPPLAALHSMTEMKAAQHQQQHGGGGPPGQQQGSHPGGGGGPASPPGPPHQTAVSQTSSTTHSASSATSNPHGIDTILSRPPPVTTAQLNALGGGMPRFTAAVAAAANMAQYLSQNHANGPMKAHAGPLVDRTHLYWPGLQGLVANPMAWRDRLGSKA